MQRTVEWLGDSRETVKSFPPSVRDELGYALYVAQMGGKHARAKPMHGLGPGVMEVTADDRSGAYRAVYTVAIGPSLYVVHAFQKKSKSGSATPKGEVEIIRQRIKRLREERKHEKEIKS